MQENSNVLILIPLLKERVSKLNIEHKLTEINGLAQAIDLKVVDSQIINLNKSNSATLIGSGKVAELTLLINEKHIKLVIIDHQLLPIQQRNLEQLFKCRVIDRTALIIDIFGARAKTNEGRLQVKLASLEYQKTRLVKSWTHLERQKGGFGFLGGPGEKQIETDRRIILNQISKIKSQLRSVINTRTLHRKSRKSVPYPIIALVGYTNAGKTSLFNQLTGSKQLAKDMLFATLDPTMRMLKLPKGKKVILSDTVGFIADLPTELIAAFKATLEEVVEADLIIHVQDISQTEAKAQKIEVEKVLDKLGINLNSVIIEVLNKVDLLTNSDQQSTKILDNNDNIIVISAFDVQDNKRLLTLIENKLATEKPELVELKINQTRELAWLYEHAQVLECFKDDSELIKVLVRFSLRKKLEFNKFFTNNKLNN